MKSLKIKDLNLRKSYFSREIQNKALKYSLIRYLNDSTLLNNKRSVLNSLKKQKNHFSKTQIVRRCVLTGRSRGSLRLFGISRILLRDLISSGFVPGYKKCVW